MRITINDLDIAPVDKVVTVKEVSQYWGYQPNTVYRIRSTQPEEYEKLALATWASQYDFDQLRFAAEYIKTAFDFTRFMIEQEKKIKGRR